MQATNRFRTLSLLEASTRQLKEKGKDFSTVMPQKIHVTEDTLEHARVVGDAIRWARKLLFRGVANNARLVNCREQIRDRAINLLTAELAAIDRRIHEPWAHLIARCMAIARYGIGNCHECSELTFLYLVVNLHGLGIDQALHPHLDHVATLVASGEHVIRCDPSTTVAVPVVQGHGNKKLDIDLLNIEMDTLGLGGGSRSGKILRTRKEKLAAAQFRTLKQAVADLDRLTPAKCLSDEAILTAPAPPITTRTGASMANGSLWPLSKKRPVAALVCGEALFDLDPFSVNDYFHALFNPLPRRDDRPFPIGCFDFADAIERLLGNDAQPLLRLIDHHGFEPDAVAPLLAELFELAIPDQPTRDDAALRLKADWPVRADEINS